MKTLILENYGVVELEATKMRNSNGGIIGGLLLSLRKKMLGDLMVAVYSSVSPFTCTGY